MFLVLKVKWSNIKNLVYEVYVTKFNISAKRLELVLNHFSTEIFLHSYKFREICFLSEMTFTIQRLPFFTKVYCKKKSVMKGVTHYILPL